MAACRACGAPTATYLCRNHTAQLMAALGDLSAGPPDQRGRPTPGLVADLDVRLARLDRIGPRPTSRVRPARPESPLPLDSEASVIAGDAARAVRGWAARAGIRPEIACATPPARLIVAVAARAARLAQHRDAADVLGAALELRQRIVAVVDQRPGRRRLGQDQVVIDRLDQADDARVTFDVAAEWAWLAFGRRLARGTFDSWVSRGRLQPLRDPAGADLRENGRRVFRWGDVAALLASAARARTPHTGSS